MQQNELYKLYEKILADREARKNDHPSIVKGTCINYCPEIERIERILRNDISIFEGNLMIKKYQRSSAGKQKPFPEDVRPLNILQNCVSYLFSLIPQCSTSFLELYKFIEDRTRAVRLDMDIQSLMCKESTLLLEKITRFYILSNLLINEKGFEVHLNNDQIKKILINILEIYQQKKGINNEEEFLSYYILINLSDKNVYNVLSNFNYHSFSKIKEALKVYEYFNQNDFYSFFKVYNNLDILSKYILLSNKEIIWNNSINMLKKSLVEQIHCNKIINLFKINKEEVLFYINNNFKMENEIIDFKSRLEPTKEIYFKETSFINKFTFNKFINYGDIDYKLKKIIIYEFVKDKFNLTRKPKKEKIIDREKTKEIIKIIIIKYAMVDLIKKTKSLSSKLLLVHDKDINSFLLVKKLSKEKLLEFNPKTILLDELTIDYALGFNLVIFVLTNANCKKANEKYFMLRKLVNNSNFWKINLNHSQIMNLINEPIIKKHRLYNILDGKDVNQSTEVIIKLIETGLNSDVLNDVLEAIHKEESFSDMDVYFYDGMFNI